MRETFDEQLLQLHIKMVEMGALCETAIAKGISAFLKSDIESGKKVVEMDENIDRAEREIEAHCLKLLLRQQPVAKDLRQISSALKMITDMERIGDQAADIAEIAVTRDTGSHPEAPALKEMAIAAVHMVNQSIDAYVKQDLALAREVIQNDDVVDALFLDIKADLVVQLKAEQSGVDYMLDLLMVAKYIERIADHATNIAEWVVFSVLGHHEDELK